MTLRSTTGMSRLPICGRPQLATHPCWSARAAFRWAGGLPTRQPLPLQPHGSRCRSAVPRPDPDRRRADRGAVGRRRDPGRGADWGQRPGLDRGHGDCGCASAADGAGLAPAAVDDAELAYGAWRTLACCSACGRTSRSTRAGTGPRASAATGRTCTPGGGRSWTRGGGPGSRLRGTRLGPTTA